MTLTLITQPVNKSSLDTLYRRRGDSFEVEGKSHLQGTEAVNSGAKW